jgi:hypothetical protein
VAEFHRDGIADQGKGANDLIQILDGIVIAVVRAGCENLDALDLSHG